VAFVSALLSPSPNLGFFGLYLWGTAGCSGSCCRRLRDRGFAWPKDRRWLLAGLLVGSVGNALVAVFQIVKNLPTPGLSLYDASQADGLMGNPIHLEALLLGGLALVLGRACRSPLRWGAVVLVLAAGLEFSFERLAVAVLAVLVLYALYTYGVRRGGTFALLIGLGTALPT